jgi:hypothetical protein
MSTLWKCMIVFTLEMYPKEAIDTSRLSGDYTVSEGLCILIALCLVLLYTGRRMSSTI